MGDQIDNEKRDGGIGNGWVIFTMLFMGFIALGMSMQDESECRGFLGIEDQQCKDDQMDQTIRNLMGGRVR